MKLPRDLSGAELAKALKAFGYQVTRQTGATHCGISRDDLLKRIKDN
ncbi:MAG: hypothetical protein LC731_00310 [Acidobacteria bacterium]|nr:hypothetical protein [Acidobacteriota bacterium]